MRYTSTKRLCSLLSVAVTAAIALPGLAAAQEVTIRGRVRNAEGKVLRQPGVIVRDAEGTKVSATPQYQDDGETFVVTVPARLGKVSVLFEDRPFHHPHLVTNLSTTPGDDHTINPVLRKASGPANYDLIVDQIQIYEQMLFSAVGAKPARDTVLAFRRDYQGLIGQMPDPARLASYDPQSVQHRALSQMTAAQRTLVGLKLRQLEGNVNELLRRSEQKNLAAGKTEQPAQATAGASKDESWRMRWHNGRWWYWSPEERWMVLQNGRWTAW